MRKISESTIKRLSKYYRSLEHLIEQGVETVSSDQLAEMDGVTSAQVRKDLSFFGSFGKRGLGYNTRALRNQIGEILGLHRQWNVAIVGAGNIGRALAAYQEFQKRGFNIRFILDKDPQKIGTEIHGVPVYDIQHAPELIAKEGVEIAIIAVPAQAAQSVADLLVEAGIKAILNFAPRSLKVPEDIHIKNENMAIEIESLSYHLNKTK